MTPDSISKILGELGQITAKIDNHTDDLQEIKVEVRKTNGRVNLIEQREAAVKAALQERQTMSAQQQGIDDRRHVRNEKWIGVFPTVIASVVSGLVVALSLLLVTHQL